MKRGQRERKGMDDTSERLPYYARRTSVEKRSEVPKREQVVVQEEGAVAVAVG